MTACSFCAKEIEAGTGSMYIQKDGRVYNFCSSKCKKNLLKLGRVGRNHKWTKAYRDHQERVSKKKQ